MKMSMNRFALVLVVSSLAGCDCGKARTRPPANADTPATTETPADAAPFTVSMLPVDSYAIGRAGIVSVEVALREGLRLDSAYPVRLSLRAPSGLGMSQGVFERTSAKTNTDSRVLFEVPVLPTEGGTGTIDGTLIFAVCEGETCGPESVPVSLELTVQ